MTTLVYSICSTLDYQLKEYFKELRKYIKNSSYYNSTDPELKLKYKKRTDGIKIGDKIGNTGIRILEANARKVQKTTKADYPIKCPLCLNLQVDKTINPYNMNRALLWRNYIIQPNSFPYFKVHFLIQSSYHNTDMNIGTQSDVHIYPNIIIDILEFTKTIGKGTILFNGWVGNSLSHLHFHYTETTFPIEEKIKEYSFEKDIMITSSKSQIRLYKDNKNNCKNFVLIKGINPATDVFKFLQYLESEKLFYNITITYKDNIFYIYIFIRIKTDDINNFNFGASNLSGLSLTTIEQLMMFKDNKKQFIDMLDKYCSESVIKIDIKKLEKLF
jgi:hypothetical protein